LSRVRTRRAALWGLILVLLVAILSGRGETTATEPLAEVNGEEITTKDLERVLGVRLAALEEQLHNLKRQGLESLIVQRLLAYEAARRGIPIPALLDAEVGEKAEPVTDEEVEAYYQANKSRLSGDETAARQNVRAHLRQQKVAIRRAIFVASLRSQATISVNLKPPPIIRVAVSVTGAPDAPVTLVEFSDFHCPFCKRAQATLKQVIERYPDKVKHVYRDFPVDKLHPQARAAHEAARCAPGSEQVLGVSRCPVPQSPPKPNPGICDNTLSRSTLICRSSRLAFQREAIARRCKKRSRRPRSSH